MAGQISLRVIACVALLALPPLTQAGAFIDGFASATTDTERGIMCAPVLAKAKAAFDVITSKQAKSGDLQGAVEQSRTLFQIAYRAEALHTFAAKSDRERLAAAWKATAEDKDLRVMSVAWRKQVDECVALYDRLVTQRVITQADERRAVDKARLAVNRTLSDAVSAPEPMAAGRQQNK